MRLVGDGVKNLELVVVVLVELQNRRLIATASNINEINNDYGSGAPVAVVRRRPDRDQGLVKVVLVALVDELVRAAHHFQAIKVTKLTQ